jgi:hypothetical protein
MPALLRLDRVASSAGRSVAHRRAADSAYLLTSCASPERPPFPVAPETVFHGAPCPKKPTRLGISVAILRVTRSTLQSASSGPRRPARHRAVCGPPCPTGGGNASRIRMDLAVRMFCNGRTPVAAERKRAFSLALRIDRHSWVRAKNFAQLDIAALHPESYGVVEQVARSLRTTVPELISREFSGGGP